MTGGSDGSAARLHDPARRRAVRLRAGAATRRARPGRRGRRGRARCVRRPAGCGAAILPEGRAGQVPGLADSKLLTAQARERCYDAGGPARALAWSVVVVEPEECDRLGMHVANVEALRRALAPAGARAGVRAHRRVPVDGLGVPGLAMWKGDRVAACIAAASVIAKVTRDRIMVRARTSGGRSTISPPTRATSPRSTQRPWTSTAPVRSTGCGSSTSVGLRASPRRSRSASSRSSSWTSPAGRRVSRPPDGRRRADERGGPREVRDRDGAARSIVSTATSSASSSTSWRPTAASTCATRST